MLDKFLTKKVIRCITLYSDGREIVFYGDSPELCDELEKHGYTIKKIFTGNTVLLNNNNSQKYFDYNLLRGHEDKFYVVIPFLLNETGNIQRDTMKKFGYLKYNDYIFYPDDENIDRILSNIAKFSNGREVVSYGFFEPVEHELAMHNIVITKRFSGNPAIVNDKSLNCSITETLKGRQNEFYIVIPFFLSDGGKSQRYTLECLGFKEHEDFCFYPKETHSAVSSSPHYDNDFKKHFYVPEKYANLWYDAFSKKYLSNRKLSSTIIENGYILPLKTISGAIKGGVCDENFQYIAGNFSCYNGNNRTGRICSAYDIDSNEIEYFDETVLFGGAMFDHPGHLMYEMFPQRIWWLIKNPDCDLKIAVVYTWGNGEARFIKEFFELFGIPEERLLLITNPAKFKKILVPDQSMYPYSADIPFDMTKEYISVYNRIKENLKPGNIKKIYLTKSKTAKQDIIGEDFFIKFFLKKGFTIINPEDYSLREKAEFMYGAEEVVTQIGTNSEYAVFCKPNVKLIVLTRVNDQIMDLQEMLNETAGITDFTVVDVALGFLHKHRIWGISMIGVTPNFRRYVLENFNEEIEYTTRDSLKEYLYDYLKRCSEYYSTYGMFNGVKNQKMISILQEMSDIFLDKNLDTSSLDTSTRESSLEMQVSQISSNAKFLEILLNDIVSQKRLYKYLLSNNCSTVSLLCDNPTVNSILKNFFEMLGIKTIFSSILATQCHELSENEWEQCRQADIILGYNADSHDPGMRNRIKAINLNDILNGYNVSVEADDTTNASALSAEMSVEPCSEEVLMLRRKNAEMAKQTQEALSLNRTLNEENALLIKSKTALEELCKTKSEENLRMLSKFNDDISRLTMEKTALTGRLNDLLLELEMIYADNTSMLQTNSELKENIDRYERSRSWRITKPLRSIAWFFHRKTD